MRDAILKHFHFMTKETFNMQKRQLGIFNGMIFQKYFIQAVIIST